MSLTSHYSRVTHEPLLTSHSRATTHESLTSHSRATTHEPLLTSHSRATHTRMSHSRVTHARTHDSLTNHYSRVTTTHESPTIHSQTQRNAALLTSNSQDCTSFSWGSFHGTLHFQMEQSKCNSNTPPDSKWTSPLQYLIRTYTTHSFIVELSEEKHVDLSNLRT